MSTIDRVLIALLTLALFVNAAFTLVTDVQASRVQDVRIVQPTDLYNRVRVHCED